MHRLVYVSTAISNITWQVVKDILVVSQERNREVGVTGLLVATRRRFFQVLEGEVEPVNDIYASIVRDSRHRAVRLVSYQEVPRRRFPDWSMHGVGLFRLNPELAADLGERFGRDGDDLVVPEEPATVTAFLQAVAPLASAQ